MNDDDAAGQGPHERPVGRPVPERAKQRVLVTYPNAYAAQDIDGFWHVWCPTVRGSLSGGMFDTRSAASWMWGTVLPTLQPLADKKGFGAQWKRMTTERTHEAAVAAKAAKAARAAGDDFWQKVDPAGLLERLIEA